MKPWEIAERLVADQDDLLLKIPDNDPFWIGASYAIDPFVGQIVKLPLRDPPIHGRGLPAEIFDKIVEQILNGNLHGDQLVMMIENLSKACTPEEWALWYKLILKGDLILPIGLSTWNKYAPHRIQPPSFNKPKAFILSNYSQLPQRFFIQPVYDGFCWWFVNTMEDVFEIRGYDAEVARIKDAVIEEKMVVLGRQHRLDVVIIGYREGHLFLVEDLLTRNQFTKEGMTPPLEKRLLAAASLGLPLVQMSDEFNNQEPSETFWRELALIHDQGYKSVMFRDLDGRYPFRDQSDYKVSNKEFAKMIRERGKAA